MATVGVATPALDAQLHPRIPVVHRSTPVHAVCGGRDANVSEKGQVSVCRVDETAAEDDLVAGEWGWRGVAVDGRDCVASCEATGRHNVATVPL